MAVAKLLGDLNASHVQLWLEREQLRFRAPPGALTAALRDRIAGCKAELMAALREAEQLAILQRRERASDDRLPMAPNQRWYLETFDPVTHKWAITLAMQVPWRVQLETLSAALAELLRRHDVFRMRQYKDSEGAWTQRVLPTEEQRPIREHDLTMFAPDEQRAAVYGIGHGLYQEIDSIAGPVLTLALCRLASNQDVILLVVHKYVIDGCSLHTLIKALYRAYRAIEGVGQVEPPSEALSYRGYLLRLHEMSMKPEFIAQSLCFWRSDGRLAPVPPLPTDFTGGRHTDLNSRRALVRLDGKRWTATTDYIRCHPGVTLNELLLYVLSEAYFRWSNLPSLRLDFEYHGRVGILPADDILATVGPTTIKFPLTFERGEPGRDPHRALRALCDELRETLDNALGHGYLRYVCPDPRVRREMASSGPPQVFFNNRMTLGGGMGELQATLRNDVQQQILVEGMDFPEPGVRENIVSYDIMVECDSLVDGAALAVVYSSALHRDATIERLCRHIESSWQELLLN